MFADSLQGLSDVLRPAAYQLIVGDSGYSEVVETSLLGNAGVPVVEIWELPQTPIDSAIGFSNYDAVYAMACYLVDSGRRRIGFIGTRHNARARARLAGFSTCLRDHDLDDRAVAYPSGAQDLALTEAVAEFSKLIQAHPRLDTLVCADDMTALDVLFTCQRNGWPVPERLAITGFCDLPIARRVHPALTTVRVPAYDIGRETARLLIERLEHHAAVPVTLDLGFEIIKRQTA